MFSDMLYMIPEEENVAMVQCNGSSESLEVNLAPFLSIADNNTSNNLALVMFEDVYSLFVRFECTSCEYR